jgi:hypothetical protein
MSDTVETPERPSATVLGGDPFTSLAVHYGMLLGVPDLETLAGHGWAKVRLHNAWLHGEGVVWGYGVSLDAESREVRVEPGLALDGLGRELYLPVRSCLDLAQWFDEHEDELQTTHVEGGVSFDAHVVAGFRACLARPVPALVTPCEGATAETAFSRLQETVELFLRPGRAPQRIERYPRLRRLLGLPASSGDAEEDARVDAAITEVVQAPGGERRARWLAAVRRFAARDVIALSPEGLFPVAEPGEVVVAELRGLTVKTAEPRTVAVDEIDPGVRWSHVATTTLSELAAFPPPTSAPPTAAGPGEPGGPADAGGPRVLPDTAAVEGDAITFRVTEPPVAATLTDAVEVHRLDDEQGWVAEEVTQVGYHGGHRRVRVRLAAAPAADAVLRVTVRGTGPRPVVAEVSGIHLPLAGLAGGPPGGRHEGHDAVFTIEGS